MSQETTIKIYERLKEFSELFQAIGEQLKATNSIFAMQQEQIINLKKRIEVLELSASYSSIQGLPQDQP